MKMLYGDKKTKTIYRLYGDKKTKTIYRLGYFDKIEFRRVVTDYDTFDEMFSAMKEACSDGAFIFEFAECFEILED